MAEAAHLFEPPAPLPIPPKGGGKPLWRATLTKTVEVDVLIEAESAAEAQKIAMELREDRESYDGCWPNADSYVQHKPAWSPGEAFDAKKFEECWIATEDDTLDPREWSRRIIEAEKLDNRRLADEIVDDLKRRRAAKALGAEAAFDEQEQG